MKRWAAAALFCALATAVTSPADAATVACRSGFTEHEERDLRVFGAYRGEDLALYTCTRARPRPVRIWEVSPATTPQLVVHGRTGNRVAISLEEFADGGNGVWVGWIDTRTGGLAFGEVRGPSSRPDPEDEGSDFTPHPDHVVVGRSGELAYAFEAGGGAYEVFTRARDGRRLGRERRIATPPLADFEPLSLAVSGPTVTWRTHGAQRSVPLTGSPTTDPPAATPSQSVRCDAGWASFSDEEVRVFEVGRRVYACRVARRARAVLLGVARPTLFARRGRVLAFATRRSVGTLETRTRAVRTSPITGPAPIALATRDGGVAFAQPGSLSYLPASGAPRRLATLAPGELDPRTLALSPSAATWRTVGEPRQAP